MSSSKKGKLKQIRKMRAEGFTMTAIAAELGVSVQLISRICRNHEVKAPASPAERPEVLQMIEQICAGKTTIKAAAKELGISYRVLRRICRENGASAGIEDGIIQRWIGKQYGDWLVTGPYEVGTPQSRTRVGCECLACGTQRMVCTANLRNGLTLGCGCRRQGKRMIVPWICEETGERFESTSSAARMAGISVHYLLRVLRGEGVYKCQDGRTLRALKEEARPH